MPEPALQIEGLEVDFPTKDGVVHAVRGVSLSLARGEVLGIVGESGSGKSVTALATMGLLPKGAKVRGSIRFGDTDILALKEKQLTNVRGTGISMIFQDPMTALNPVYTIGWQIVEAIQAHQDMSKEAARARAVELLAKVGIPNPAERIDNYPHEFSGGMRQRAVIAIAMANDPEVILADEPTTALDVTVQAQVLNSLRTAMDETGAALLLITHDLGVIAGLADRVLVMYAGRAVEIGTAEGRVLSALHAVHLGAARLVATARRRRVGAPATDPGLPSLHGRGPTRMPLRPPLPPGHRPLPRNGARPRSSCLRSPPRPASTGPRVITRRRSAAATMDRSSPTASWTT